MSENLRQIRDWLAELGLEKNAIQSDTKEEIEDPRDEIASPGSFSTELDSTLESESEGSVTEKGQESAAEQNTNQDPAPTSDATMIGDDPKIEKDFTETEGKEDVEGDGKGGTDSGIVIQDAVDQDANGLKTATVSDLTKWSQALKNDLLTAGTASNLPVNEQLKSAAKLVAKTAQTASYHADLTAGYLQEYSAKVAMDLEQEVAAQETEKKQDEEAPPEGVIPEGVIPEEGGGEEALLAAMESQPMPEEGPPVAPEEPLGRPAVIPEEGAGEGLPPEEALLDPQIHADLTSMGPEGAMQELAMALEELGISPEELVAASATQQDEPAKMAMSVVEFKRAGQMRLTTAEENSPQRHVRDYMKGVVLEHFNKKK